MLFSRIPKFFRAFKCILWYNISIKMEILHIGGLKMADKSRVKIVIGGKNLTLMGYETEEHIKNVAAYIEEKLRTIKSNASRSLDASLTFVLTSINVADDYFKEVDKNKGLQEKIEILEQENRDLRKKLKYKPQTKKRAHPFSQSQSINNSEDGVKNISAGKE